MKNIPYLIAATRFRKISDRLYLDGDKVYKKHGVEFKATWFSLYHTLLESSRPQTVLELADAIGFSHITVKNIVRELQAVGLTDIKANPADGRSKLISLSKKGIALQEELLEVWDELGSSIKIIFDAAHPDFRNSINRIEAFMDNKPLDNISEDVNISETINIIDYIPEYKMAYIRLIREWLMFDQRVHLEGDEKFSLNNPAEAYLLNGGFIFFAIQENEPVGCVAVKRLDSMRYEISKFSVPRTIRRKGIASKLLQRVISRCRENNARELWAQTTGYMDEMNTMLEVSGFEQRTPPSSMLILKRMEIYNVLKI